MKLLYDDSRPETRHVAMLDRASNVFFLPPEYQSVNCVIGCNVWSASIWASSTSIFVGDSVLMVGTVSAEGTCQANYAANFDFDGNGTLDVATNDGEAIADWTYLSQGTFHASMTAFCGCTGVVQVALRTISVAAAPPPPPGCNTAGARTVSSPLLLGLPKRRAYEFGFFTTCVNSVATASSTVNSANEADVCRLPLNFGGTQNKLLFSHTHPKFTSNNVGSGVTCSTQVVNNMNFAAVNASPGVKNFSDIDVALSNQENLDAQLRSSDEKKICNYSSGSVNPVINGVCQ